MTFFWVQAFLFSLIRLGIADVQCYKCVWTNYVLSDFCFPTKFNETLVPIEVCKLGCMTTATYHATGSMDTYTRGCSLKHVDYRYNCTDKPYRYTKEVSCFCATDLCNGLGFAAPTDKTRANTETGSLSLATSEAINEPLRSTTSDDIVKFATDVTPSSADKSSNSIVPDFSDNSPNNATSSSTLEVPTDAKSRMKGARAGGRAAITKSPVWVLSFMLLIFYTQCLRY